jgi:hypothetical protein
MCNSSNVLARRAGRPLKLRWLMADGGQVQMRYAVAALEKS